MFWWKFDLLISWIGDFWLKRQMFLAIFLGQ